MNIPDRIERETVIAAPVEKVWDLVSVPGWWINGGKRIDFAAAADGFDVELVSADAPGSVSFRWRVSGAEGPQETVPEDQLLHTLVVFTLTEVEGGTRLSVVESGFATARMDEAARSRAYRDNTGGWDIEMRLAKSHIETARTAESAGGGQ